MALSGIAGPLQIVQGEQNRPVHFSFNSSPMVDFEGSRITFGGALVRTERRIIGARRSDFGA
jgi:hypothetical protein